MNRVKILIKLFIFIAIILSGGLWYNQKCLAGGQLSEPETKEYAQNNINLYNPYECLSGGGGRAVLLSGNTIEEKIWNYFVQAGIPGVSDDPAVIAGILGNFYTESGYNPFMRGSNGKYRALWMLMDSYNGVRYALDLATEVNAAVGGNYWKFYGWWGSPTDADNKLASAGIPESAIDTAIAIELDYLTKSEKYAGNWNGFINHLDWVSNKNPSGYSDLFLVTIERAVNGSSPIADPGVRSHISGMYQGSAKRRQAAEDAYSRLANSGSLSSPSSPSANTSSTTSESSATSDSSTPVSSDSSTTSNSSSSTTSASSSATSSNSNVNLSAITSEITLVGDSLSVFSETELMQKFPNSFLNKVGSRHSTTKGSCAGDEGGLDVLKKIVNGSGTIINQHKNGNCESVTVDSSSLKENIVWELGTNTNGASESTLESVLDLVGSRRLFLVTPFNNSSQFLPNIQKTTKEYTDEKAEIYRSFANAHDNVYIVDWNKEVRDNVSTYILSDNVHPTPEGTKLMAKLIYEAVSGSKSCTTYEGDYPQYLQCDPKWKTTKYGGSDMCNAGCGPASLAMLVTVATGKDVLPTDVATLTEDPPYYSDDVGGQWMRVQNTQKVCEKYGCEAKEIPNDEESIKQALKDGWMIHFSGGGGSSAETTAFPTDGHYVGIFSIDNDDNVMIADPAGNAHQVKKNRFNRKLSFNDAVKDRWRDRPIMAIRGAGGNTGKNTCEVAGNYCANGGNESNVSGTVGEGGLTFEQAKVFMMHYGENKNGSSKVAVNKDGSAWKLGGCNGGGGSNCVTFSAFFMNKFTDSTRGRGNGNVTASGSTNVDGKGTEPRIWAVFSGGTNSRPHTGVILGYHDGEWIVGHASCHSSGTGTGTGGDGTWAGRGSGAGFVIKSADICKAILNYCPANYAYPKNVDVSAIENYLETGE